MTVAKQKILACVPQGWTSTAKSESGGNYDIEGGAEVAPPDPGRWLELCEIDYRLMSTAGRKRNGELRDPSPSGYDMAMASLLAAIPGVSDQEIINICIWARQKNGEDTSKCRRRDYWERTLRRARGDKDDAPEEPDVARDILAERFKVESLRFIKYMSQPAVYAMVVQVRDDIEAFEYRLGGAATILSAKTFERLWFDATGKHAPVAVLSPWSPTLDLITASLEERGMDGEGSDSHMAQSLVREYLTGPGVFVTSRDDEEGAAVMAGKPLVDDADYYVHLTTMTSWANLNGMRPDRASIMRGLKALGANRETITVNRPQRTSRSYYRISKEVVEWSLA